FAFLPRKFKIAVSGALSDRAAVGIHDIGLHAVERDGEVGFRVWVGGGLGRTPIVGKLINEYVRWPDLLTYLQAVLRVYNLYGRRDNKFKARIKILVKDLTPETFAQEVQEVWQKTKGGPDTLTQADVDRVSSRFTVMPYTEQPQDDGLARHAENKAFARWMQRNVHPHKVAGYAAVTVSLKATVKAAAAIT